MKQKEKETENEVLLSISNQIARIRNKGDMLQLIRDSLKKYFRFSDSQILRYIKSTRTCKPFIYHAEIERSRNPNFKNYLDQEYAVADDSTENFLDPIVYDIASLIPGGCEQIHFMYNEGIREFVVIKLIEGNELIGLLVLLSEKINSFQTKDLELLQKISFQIAIATANIIADEEIAKKETENTILLSLTTKIAAVRNKNELLELLNNNLKHLFAIKGFGITLINADRKTHSPFVVDVQDELKRGNDFSEAVSQTYSVSDGVFNVIINSENPVALIVDELVQMPESPAYVQFWKKMDVKQVIGTRVAAGSNNLGCFILLHDSHSGESINNNLFRGVCAQVSVAISHILANDEIAKGEEEKTILLSLSNEISSLKNRTDLFKVVNERIKKLFSITEFAIAKIDENLKTYSAFMLDLEDRITTDADFNATTSDHYNINDTLFTKVMNSDNPVMFQVDDIVNSPGMPSFVHFWKKVGLQKVLCAALRTGGEPVGMAVLHIDSNNHIDPQSIFLKGICAQLSVAISNILAHEQIERREAERDLLLSLNLDIAAVRSNTDLLTVINQKLKKLLGFSHTLIAIINEDRITTNLFATDPVSITKNLPENLKKGIYPVNDGILPGILSSPGVSIFDLKELKKTRDGDMPIYFKVGSENGSEQALMIRFSKGAEVLGAWIIIYNKKIQLIKNTLNLIEGLANQLSVSIANIIAYDEIKGRETEKAKLLAFSNIMASSRDKGRLGKILTRQLKEILGVKGYYMLYALTDDKKRYYPLLFDPDASPANLSPDPNFERMIRSDDLVSESIFEKILTLEEPLLFRIEERYKKPMTPSYAKMMEERGITKITGAAIRLGDENIGVILFDTNNESLGNRAPLFKSICSQIAISVSNILAYEKMNNQLFEINKYKQQLEEEKIYLQEEIETTQNFSELIGESEEMKKVFRLVKQVSSSISTVLILGETGTGKELIARAIHNGSPRKNKLMVKVNCAAIPPNLIESELFGHERGSFTGATERRIGKFELAHHGTLFLDEIGEMPLEMQVKLLRALQEKEIERVGGTNTIRIDVRIIAATNRDLEKLMEEGKFRTDLYYRLNIFPINLPPLRSRKEDIPAMALFFVKRFSKKAGKKNISFSNKVMEDLIQYNWPGNIRELEHLIERSVLIASGDTIKEIHLPSSQKNKTIVKNAEPAPTKTIDENEREYILKVLKHVKGKISGEGGAAKLLGIPPSTLNSKLIRLGIHKEHLG